MKEIDPAARRVAKLLTPPSGKKDVETAALEDLRDDAARIADQYPTPLTLLIASLTRIAAIGPTPKQAELVTRLHAALEVRSASVVRSLPDRPWLSIADLVPVLGVGDPKGAKRWLEKRRVPMTAHGRNLRVLVADLKKKAPLEWSELRKRYEQG